MKSSIFNVFKPDMDEKKIAEKLGSTIRIQNGVGLGFISLKRCIDDLLNILPIKNHIGLTFDLLNFQLLQNRIHDLERFSDLYNELEDSNINNLKIGNNE